jgi:hypothetical protein
MAAIGIALSSLNGRHEPEAAASTVVSDMTIGLASIKRSRWAARRRNFS